jgi:hypothetical protein
MAVKVKEVAKVAMAIKGVIIVIKRIKGVIIVIKRIKVVEVFKEEDIEDINLRAGLIYIN